MFEKHLPEQFKGECLIINGEEIEESRLLNREKLRESYKRRELLIEGIPQHLWVEPTNACNARCPLCPTGDEELNRPKAMMDLEMFQKIVDQIYPYASSMNLWNVGEPFLNPDLFKMILYASRHRITTRVSTNGYVFYNPENVKELIECGLDNLVVSMDGATADVFNQYRVNVDFKKVLSGLYFLAEEKQRKRLNCPTVVWQFIIMKHNQHEIDMARQLAGEVKAVFSLKTVNMDMVQSPPDFEKYLPEEENLHRYKRDQTGKYILKTERRNTCPALWSSLMINADGQVVPCCYDYESELSLGYFPNQTIAEIWNGEAMQTLRRQILEDRNALKPCRKCSVDDHSLVFINIS